MTLLDGLISYWKLEEASGSRLDSHGANDLTDVNTVTSNPGIVRTGGQFTAANSEYLSHVDNADLSVADIDFCFSVWVYLDSLGSVRGIITKDLPASSREYLLYKDSSNQINWFVGNGTSQVGFVTHTTVLSTATWYHIYCYHDSVNNQVGVSLNNGAAQTAATTGVPGNGAAEFDIGNRVNTPILWNGRIDEVGFWKRLLTTDERTRLYNGGRGVQYPFYTDRALDRGLVRGLGRGIG